MSLIELKNVTAGYGKTPVLKDISLMIEEGESVMLGGPNGAGKTTLLRVIASLLPLNGEITLAGDDASSLRRRDIASLIALMPQTQDMYFSYTVSQAVMLGRYVRMRRGLAGPSAEDKEITDRVMNDCGVYELKDRLLSELSGGQLQRALLARTFAQQTPVVLLDEPGNNLDVRYRAELTDYMAKWLEGTSEYNGKQIRNTLIGVFHDLGEAAGICRRGVFVKDGQIVSDTALKDAFNSKVLNEVYDFDVISYKRAESAFWNS